ncbi:retrovirus-related pol polyprotein from transposon TNT 1-94 [Tanacetum coccineum]|uniref:Retrovirus-related pol polyprotein from transposon TNT 1-94 n=1 Tax=Tanacetum coccineum TaxID=301880 RepID=A0ABQ5BYZ1_9ASTR
MNKVKKVRFTEPLISSSNIKQVESSKTSNSNTHVLSSTGYKCSTSNCGSKPTRSKNNDRISQTPSRNMKNKVESQPRKLNKKNHVVEPIHDEDGKHSLLNANSELICATYNKCMFDAIHDMCLLDFVKNVNGHSKSTEKHKNKIFGNLRVMFTPTKVVPIKESTSSSVEASKPELKFYSRRPKHITNVGLSKKAKIVESKNANNSEPNQTWGSNATDIPSPSYLVNDRNDQVAKIMGYGDYQLGNNLEGVDLLSGSRDTDLYIISLDDMLKTSLIFLLSKASKTKSWLWYHRLLHLNFDTINELDKDGLARGISKLKFQKDHLCSSCALGKSKKSSHQPKAEDTNQEKLYLLHMDLCGPMHVERINGKKYILVIIEDYSQFIWVRFLRSKDEAPEAIIKCIKNIQVRLNAIVRNIRTDNGTEFVNQTLHDFYENESISHQTSIARTPQQNSVVERRNQTLVEAARTMLIFLKLHCSYGPKQSIQLEYLKMVMEAQVQFDQALRASLEKVVTASGPGFGDWQWRLATLLIKLGGLGILSARDIFRLDHGAKEGPMGFLSEEGKNLRPADLLLFNWLQGKDACLDVTCISPFAGMGATACVPGAALHNAVEKKKKKYGSVCEENR